MFCNCQIDRTIRIYVQNVGKMTGRGDRFKHAGFLKPVIVNPVSGNFKSDISYKTPIQNPMQGPRFIIDKAALENQLKKIKPDGRRKKKVINQLVLEVSLTTDLMTLTVPGFHLDLEVQGTGAGKVSTGLLHFIHIVENLPDGTFILQLLDGEIRVNDKYIQADVWLYQNDSILRKINLPVNYSELQLLRLPILGYTDDELYFNKLSVKVDIAQKHLERNISEAADILDQYGIGRKELSAFIKERVYALPDSHGDEVS